MSNNGNICYGWYYIKIKSSDNNENIIKDNFDGDNTAFILKDFEWNKNKIFEASIDLTNCKNTNENIISIGNNIKEWQGADIINLHLYYDISSNKLIIDWVNQDDPYTSTANPKYEFTLYPDSKTLLVKITSYGLFINNKKVTSDWFETRFVSQIYSIGDNIQAGAAQGRVMSNAHYNYIKTYDKAEVVLFGHLPWSDKKADGISKQQTEESFDYFTQKIVATIDLSYCINLDSTSTQRLELNDSNNNNNIAVYADSSRVVDSKDYTILSIGTDIKDYGTVNDNNFHVYYNAINKNILMDCVNNTAGTGKYNKTVTLDDSTSVITLEIYNKDFKLNDTSFSDVLYNIIPVIKNKTLQLGFVQGDGYISLAFYKDVHIEDLTDDDKIEYITLPQENFVPSYKSKKWLANIDKSQITDSSSYILSMEVNTDNCSGSTYQNLLSVGTNIISWASKYDYNIHLYYNKSKNLIQSNLTNSSIYKASYKRQDITNLPSVFNINVSYNDGISIKTGSDCTVINDSDKFISYMYNSNTDIEYGACEGDSRFMGQYSYMKYVEDKLPVEDIYIRIVPFISYNDIYQSDMNNNTKRYLVNHEVYFNGISPRTYINIIPTTHNYYLAYMPTAYYVSKNIICAPLLRFIGDNSGLNGSYMFFSGHYVGLNDGDLRYVSSNTFLLNKNLILPLHLNFCNKIGIRDQSYVRNENFSDMYMSYLSRTDYITIKYDNYTNYYTNIPGINQPYQLVLKFSPNCLFGLDDITYNYNGNPGVMHYGLNALVLNYNTSVKIYNSGSFRVYSNGDNTYSFSVKLLRPNLYPPARFNSYCRIIDGTTFSCTLYELSGNNTITISNQDNPNNLYNLKSIYFNK